MQTILDFTVAALPHPFDANNQNNHFVSKDTRKTTKSVLLNDCHRQTTYYPSMGGTLNIYCKIKRAGCSKQC